MLAGRFKQNVSALATMLRPDNVPVFSTKLPEAEAIALWQKHFGDEGGAQALSALPADEILKLHVRLAQAQERVANEGGGLL